MRAARALLIAAVVTCAALDLASAQSPGNGSSMPGMSGDTSMPGMKGGAAAAQSQADRDMMDAMTKMNRGMSAAPSTGDADQDFVAMMIPHHQGAIDMAAVELKYGHDPKLRALAKNIISAQQKEIKEMRDWQARHRKKH